MMQFFPQDVVEYSAPEFAIRAFPEFFGTLLVVRISQAMRQEVNDLLR